MLVFFIGPTLEAARQAVRSHAAKKPLTFARTLRMDKQNWNAPEADAAISSVSLFGEMNKLVIDDLFDESVLWLQDQAKELISGLHQIWIITTVDAHDKYFSASAQKCFKDADIVRISGIDPKKAEGERAQRKRFSFVDAVVSRDRKKAWLLYDELRSEGVAAEELTGLLMWGMRSLGLGVLAGQEGLAALSPYQRTKYAAASKKWPADELKDFVFALVSGLHESRLGNGTADMSLERLIVGKL